MLNMTGKIEFHNPYLVTRHDLIIECNFSFSIRSVSCGCLHKLVFLEIESSIEITQFDFLVSCNYVIFGYHAPRLRDKEIVSFD